MAHRRSFRGRGITDAQRRKKLWSPLAAPAAAEDQLTSGDISVTLNYQLSSSGAAAPGPLDRALAYVFPSGGANQIPAESTILRIRGTLELPKIEVSMTDIDTTAFGIGVMESGAADQSAFPNPASPDGSTWDGWMFYRSQAQGALDANAGIVDVKAMRKIQSGQSLVLVMGQYAASLISVGGDVTIPAMAGSFTARALFLLP